MAEDAVYTLTEAARNFLRHFEAEAGEWLQQDLADHTDRLEAALAGWERSESEAMGRDMDQFLTVSHGAPAPFSDEVDDLLDTVEVHIRWLRRPGTPPLQSRADNLQSADYLKRLASALRSQRDSARAGWEESEVAHRDIDRLERELAEVRGTLRDIVREQMGPDFIDPELGGSFAVAWRMDAPELARFLAAELREPGSWAAQEKETNDG